MSSANQIAEFLNLAHLKKYGVTRPDILHFKRVLRKFNDVL